MGNSSRKHGPSCRGRSFFVLIFPAFNCYNLLTLARFCADFPSFCAWQVQSGLVNPTTFYINRPFQLFVKLMFHEELTVFARFALFCATRLYINKQLRRDPFRLDCPPTFSCPDCPALSLAVFSRPGHHPEEQDGLAGQTTPVSVCIRPNENRRSNHQMLLFRFLCHLALLSLFQCTRSLFYRLTS